MKNELRRIGLVLITAVTGVWLAGCVSTSKSTSDSIIPSVVALPPPSGWPKSIGGGVVRLVDGTGSPIAGVLVTVYPEDGPGHSAGLSNEKGELILPVQPFAIYQFNKNGHVLLAQTTQNLFSLGPSAPHYYRYDGATVIVPLNFAPTSSPLISPIIDPMNPASSAPQPRQMGR